LLRDTLPTAGEFIFRVERKMVRGLLSLRAGTRGDAGESATPKPKWASNIAVALPHPHYWNRMSSTVFPPEPKPTPIAQGAFWLFFFLATLVSTCALVSLIARGFDIALNTPFAGLLTLYRTLTYPAFELVLTAAAALSSALANPPIWANDVVGLLLANGLCFALLFAAYFTHRLGIITGFFATALVAVVAAVAFPIIARLAIEANATPPFPPLVALLAPVIATSAFFVANACV
jgi:hypothetical protein